MKLLALDTSTQILSLALSDNEKVIQHNIWQFDKKVSQMVMPTLEQFLNDVQWDSKDIDGYVVGLGPGSFTSLRVGLSVAKALAFAHQKPIMGISSLTSLAVQAEGDRVCVLADARRNLLYSSFYHRQDGRLIQQGECELLNVDSVLEKIDQGTVCVGSGVSLYRDKFESAEHVKLLADNFEIPNAQFLLPEAFIRIQDNDWDDINGLAPMYVHPEDCMVTKSK